MPGSPSGSGQPIGYLQGWVVRSGFDQSNWIATRPSPAGPISCAQRFPSPRRSVTSSQMIWMPLLLMVAADPTTAMNPATGWESGQAEMFAKKFIAACGTWHSACDGEAPRSVATAAHPMDSHPVVRLMVRPPGAMVRWADGRMLSPPARPLLFHGQAPRLRADARHDVGPRPPRRGGD